VNKTIKSTDYDTLIVDEFDILVDTDKKFGPVVGIKVTPRDGSAFIMPVAVEGAKELAFTIFKTCLFAAPELFEFPQAA
jgi:hypothetical protein